jgi:surfactin family lipopeptide synthetase A
MQIVSRLQQAGYRAGIKEVMRYQTIEQLAPHVVVSKTEYEQGTVRGTIGLTPIANWFFSQQFTNPHHFNQSVLLRFPNGVDKGRLERAFAEIIKHHDGLRTNYDPISHRLFYNEKHTWFTLEPERKASFHEIGAKLKSSFNIEQDLLIKAQLASENHLLITAHHLVIDGVSWRILLEDLYSAYYSKQLPPKTASLIDWPTEESPVKTVPVHYGTVNDMQTISFVLSEDITKLPFENNITIDIILLTALLRSYNTEKLLIEMEHHGRSMEGIDFSRTIGWFTSMFPVEFRLKGQTMQEQLAAIRAQLNDSKNNIHTYENFPTIRFNYLGRFELQQFSGLFEIADLETGPDVAPANQLTASIELLFMVRNNRLTGTVNYSSVTESKDSISSMISSLKKNVAAIFDCLENRGNTAFTPLEFETAGLDQGELDSLFN